MLPQTMDEVSRENGGNSNDNNDNEESEKAKTPTETRTQDERRATNGSSDSSSSKLARLSADETISTSSREPTPPASSRADTAANQTVQKARLGSRGPPASRRVEVRLLVRRREAGALIGKRGANIKRLRETYNRSLFNIPDTGNGPERVVCVAADSSANLGAILADIAQLFLEKARSQRHPALRHSAASGHEDQIELKQLIKSAHAGLLIGMGGQSIRKLRQDSKAAIKIYEMCCPHSDERVCAIKATPSIVVSTIKLIQEIIDASPPALKATIVQKPYDALNFDSRLVDKYGGYPPDDLNSIELLQLAGVNAPTPVCNLLAGRSSGTDQIFGDHPMVPGGEGRYSAGRHQVDGPLRSSGWPRGVFPASLGSQLPGSLLDTLAHLPAQMRLLPPAQLSRDPVPYRSPRFHPYLSSSPGPTTSVSRLKSMAEHERHLLIRHLQLLSAYNQGQQHQSNHAAGFCPCTDSHGHPDQRPTCSSCSCATGSGVQDVAAASRQFPTSLGDQQPRKPTFDSGGPPRNGQIDGHPSG